MPTKKPANAKGGLQFRRRFTRDDVNVFDQFEYDYRTSVIRNPSGEVVFNELPKLIKYWAHYRIVKAQAYDTKAGMLWAGMPILFGGRSTAKRSLASCEM
jgi:ribonucleoside-diphosphate reductase alpha chain